MIGFDDFASYLPYSKCVLGEAGSPAFRTPTTGIPEYLAPELKHRVDISENPVGPILLVTAPAAVGKTSFAEELAQRVRCPIWDLSLAPSIGSGALDGQMNNAFGRQKAGQYLTLVENGEACVLIDALDEARIRITEATFADFLTSLYEISKNSRGVSFVILGRKQVIEDAWLYLSERELTAPVYEIAYFDKQRATRFLDSYVKRFSPEGEASRIAFRESYQQARNTIIGAIEASVPDDKASDFIGYAPVLMAIARALSDEKNYYGVVQKWSGEEKDRNGGPIGIVIDLIFGILEREQGKFALNAPQDIRNLLGNSPAASIYTPKEQCFRILYHILEKEPLSQSIAPDVPSDLEESYEESIGSFLRDHPFLSEGTRSAANVVFRDYLYAFALREDSDLAAEIILRARGSAVRPSPLLFEFYFRNSQQPELPKLYSKHVGLIYESALASETIDKTVQFSIESSSDDNETDLVGAIEFYTEGDDGAAEPRVLQFTTPDSDIVEFDRILSNADIDIDQTLKLTSPTREFEFIGDIWINAAKIDFQVETIVVRPHRPERTSLRSNPTSTTITASSVEGQISRPPKVFGSLLVEFSGAERYPWTKYKSDLSTEIASGSNYERSERILKRIVTAFRSHSRGSLARFRGKIESDRVSRGILGKELLARLLDDKILTLVGKFYFLDPVACSDKLGVTYYDLKNRTLTPRAKNYLESFLAHR